eukprot:CAMPEP_0202967324 /NCGR_PEP_ID=MMETSP1396-20130829/12140_1 /ASSEMBLY_ACC=CAM_ASM_000872 /TAXON_ID= /ORGANISM="Pseudokeronopsis sp., Strain Brazil" /LENGTH=72 /DNA_ID=CAMNT_0049692243 /DNA_START=302 /DNA_END=520 /DNA_ORIENTATION=-
MQKLFVSPMIFPGIKYWVGVMVKGVLFLKVKVMSSSFELASFTDIEIIHSPPTGQITLFDPSESTIIVIKAE